MEIFAGDKATRTETMVPLWFIRGRDIVADDMIEAVGQVANIGWHWPFAIIIGSQRGFPRLLKAQPPRVPTY